jgi:hypothetical protein
VWSGAMERTGSRKLLAAVFEDVQVGEDVNLI